MSANHKDGDNPERRFMIRYPSNANVTFLRESDKMRNGVDAKLENVSTTGIGIRAPIPLEINEQVKLRLRNEVQRFEKDARGTVRHCTAASEQEYLVGIELIVRLTPLEVSFLKMGISIHPPGDEPTLI
jgi:hypothetical protein